MKQVAKFIANDGEEFDTMEQCLRYEAQLKLSEAQDDIWLFDDECRPLPLTEDNISIACFIWLLSDKAVRTMRQLCVTWGARIFDDIITVGKYQYLDGFGWLNMDTEKYIINGASKKMEEAKAEYDNLPF